MQSEHIKERIAQFGNKLYLEFGVGATICFKNVAGI
ncbi:MAG: hypothetical protein ACLVKJ_09415 [Acutalibacteraceae bacterium]